MTDPSPDLRRRIAPSVSPAAREKLDWLGGLMSAAPPPNPPQTLDEFDAAAAQAEVIAQFLTSGALAAMNPVVLEGRLGGIPVLEITPRGDVHDGTVLVYVHGGGFVQNSARSSLLMAALIAAKSGRKVVSIDYTLAPRGNCESILEEVIAVWSALLETRAGAAMGLIGDSAGGCIAASVTHLLRDRSIAMPAALILLSPAADLTLGGDTNLTLTAVDYLDPAGLANGVKAYAGGLALDDPRVSPLFGDFGRGFPPTLLQAGTRELLLSDSVRLHRALRSADVEAQLDVYDGMPHVFQSLLADTPEGVAAWREMTLFWARHIRPAFQTAQAKSVQPSVTE